MANTIKYPKTDYTEDYRASRRFARLSIYTAPVLIVSFILGLILIWNPSIL